MDFTYSEEQQMLEDTVTRFVQERYDIKQRDQYLAEQAGYSETNWRTLAEMGLLGLLAPESEGGWRETHPQVHLVKPVIVFQGVSPSCGPLVGW